MSFGSGISSRDLNRGNSKKRATETYPRVIFEPFIVASKPIHPSTLNEITVSSKPKIKTAKSTTGRARSSSTMTLVSDKKRSQLVLSDLSNYESSQRLSTPSPLLLKTEPDILHRKISTPTSIRFRAPSSIQLSSTTRFKTQPPRCHSATDIKSSYSANKNSLRFILIADEEHRIESWYHQYPFILGDDLLTLFEAKQSQQKLILSAYFVDGLQLSKANATAKTFLQGKPFNINNDWRKYDLIFISNNIYQPIIIHLQTIINLINLSGKIVKIYQVNHEEDLKRQVKSICKQLQQQNV